MGACPLNRKLRSRGRASAVQVIEGNSTSAMTWRMPRRWAIIRAVIQLSPVIM